MQSKEERQAVLNQVEAADDVQVIIELLLKNGWIWKEESSQYAEMSLDGIKNIYKKIQV